MNPEIKYDLAADPWAKRHLAEYHEEHKFVERLRAAEIHWFFIQGLKAIRGNLYVPGVCSLLNGIEASLRVTLARANSDGSNQPSPYKVLSNTLLRDGQQLGLPVETLAFPGEVDFLAKLATVKPNKVDVEVVRQRHNLCHGNVSEYINRELGPEYPFFTPECLRELAEVLLAISDRWTDALGQFKRAKGWIQE